MPRLLDPGRVFEDNNGTPLASGTMTFYDSGTVTLKTTYANSAMTIANQNPMTFGSDGRLNVEVFGTGTYTVKVSDANGTTIWSEDEVGEDVYDQGGTGASERSLQDKVGETVSVKDFGAVGDGTTDDTSAISNAIGSGVSEIYFPSGTYLITSTLALTTNVTLYGRATIKKGGNIDMITMAGGSRLIDLTLDGEGGTYTGRGVVISSGNDQLISHCTLTDMNGYCLEFGADVGQRFQSVDSFFERTTTDNPAIGFSTTAETVGNRGFLGCRGSRLFTTLGSFAVRIVGCSFTNMTFSSLTKKIVISGNRINTGGSAFAVDGIDGTITGNSIAGSVTFASTTANYQYSGNVLPSGSTVTDSSSVATNWIYDSSHDLAGTYIPTWSAATTAPVVGNGTLDGRFLRSGRKVTVHITLTMGSTTTFGTGVYSFSLPSPLNKTVLDDATGIVFARDTSATAHYVGAVRVSGGSAPSFVIYSTGTAQWGPTVPFTWASGDLLKFSITYEIG